MVTKGRTDNSRRGKMRLSGALNYLDRKGFAREERSRNGVIMKGKGAAV